MHIVEAAMFCGKQCLPLQGDHEKLGDDGNPGNFLAFLKVLAKHDMSLNEHLESAMQRKGSLPYLSPKIQKEIAEVMGIHMVQKKVG